MMTWPSLALTKGYMLAAIFTCPVQTPPVVTVQFQSSPPHIINDKSSSELAALKKNSTSPNYGSEFPIVGGLTFSNFKVEYSMDLMNGVQSVLRKACLWATKINVVVTYTPTVYVASNHAPGSCHYKMTERHEMMHVNVDVITLKEFLPQVKKAVEGTVATWRGVGPVDQDGLKAAESELSKPLKVTLDAITDKLQQARRARQQQVDSRDEYRYLSTACAQAR